MPVKVIAFKTPKFRQSCPVRGEKVLTEVQLNLSGVCVCVCVCVTCSTHVSALNVTIAYEQSQVGEAGYSVAS